MLLPALPATPPPAILDEPPDDTSDPAAGCVSEPENPPCPPVSLDSPPPEFPDGGEPGEDSDPQEVTTTSAEMHENVQRAMVRVISILVSRTLRIAKGCQTTNLGAFCLSLVMVTL